MSDAPTTTTPTPADQPPVPDLRGLAPQNEQQRRQTILAATKPALIMLDSGDEWVDFAQDVPMELVEMIREKGKNGRPVTIWSKHLVEADFAALLWNWLIEADSKQHPLSMQLVEPPRLAPPNEANFEVLNFSAPVPSAAPEEKEPTREDMAREAAAAAGITDATNADVTVDIAAPPTETGVLSGGTTIGSGMSGGTQSTGATGATGA